jgi:hypothetical protein
MAGASLSEARRFENIHLTTGKVCRNVADDLGNYCLSSAVLGGARINPAHEAAKSESG